jgi:antirestriction protein ArdC
VAKFIEELMQEVIDNMQNRPAIKHGFTKACYIPDVDEVHMPDPSKFDGTPEYFSTLFHELTHSTLHATRCNRKLTGAVQFGNEEYSREELVAEMGAAFLCGETGISAPVIENQASYIASWLKALNNDRKLIVNAAGTAQKAVDYILNRNFNAPAEAAI